MESRCQYVKFFRVRSRAVVQGYDSDNVNWIFSAIDLLDFTPQELIYEAFTIGQLSYGGFSYGQLREMPFDDYMILYREADRLSKDLKKDAER